MNVTGPTYGSSIYGITGTAGTTTGRGAVAAQTSTTGTEKTSPDTLTAEQVAELRRLQAEDKSVRQHEQAHLSAAGGLAVSGARYSYEKGPDGISYAIGGEVSIDTSPGRTPEETLRKAQTIQAAALAPADPSAQDRSVAAEAAQMAQQAQQEITQSQIQDATTEKPGRDSQSQAVRAFYGNTDSRATPSIDAYA